MARRRDLPGSAQCVIVGGGVGGASIAYHLAQKGWRDVVLLDRKELTSGSTFHSAGLVGQLRGSVVLTKMMMYGVELYRQLEAISDRTDFSPGWTESGGIRLASSDERMEELRRQAGWAKTFGLEMELIGPAEAQELFPLMETDGVRGGLYIPTDGYLDPSQLTYALAHGAREGGCDIHTNTRVTGILREHGRVTGVETERGTIRTDVVVNAGGMFGAEIGRLAGVRVPVIPMEHQYIVTKGFRERGERPLPTLRDPDLLVYFREDAEGLVMGGYERNPNAWSLDAHHIDRIPPTFNGQLLDYVEDRFEELSANAVRRVPALDDVEVRILLNGPEGFTPDGEFLMGETGLRGFYVACGFCAHGLAGAGGIGQQMAEWIVEGEPALDLWEMDIRRFGAQYRSGAYTHKRTMEVYETYYDIKYPGHERQAGRPLRLSSAYGWHRTHGAAFGEKGGWERVNWYEPNAADGDESLRPRGWAGKLWSPAIGAEHRATRTAAGLFDESSFAKIEVTGPGAAAYLQTLCDNDVARGAGQITYTQMLNSRGGIECDFTVTRLAADAFRIVTGTAFGNHDIEWIRKHAPGGGSVRISDVTSQSACFALWGPRARDILAALTDADLSGEAFPYMTAQEIAVGSVPCLALRVTFVGELGWELYCPTEFGGGLWRSLVEAGEPHGLRPCGYKAIDTLRLEQGYRVWAADITPDENPYEGGLGFCVKLDKPGGFIGRDALAAAKQRGLERKLCCMTLADPRSICLGNEPVRVGGEIVGRVTTGGFGYSVERSIAYAYLPAASAEPGTRGEIEVFGEWIEAEVASEPLFDPKGERVRA